MAEPPASTGPGATPGPTRIAVGKITKAHGVHGEVAVLVLSDNEDRFALGDRVDLEDGRTLMVATARNHHGRLLVTFEGVRGRDEAERLRGCYLFVAPDALPPLSGDAWWPHDLEGCAVVTDTGRALGTLTEVLHTEANDVWVVQGDREVLVPALRDVVAEVDIDAKRVVVHEVEGLTTPDEE